MDLDFKGRTYVVSGTASGIGCRTAGLLLEADATVIGLDLQPQAITHDRYRHVILDVTDEDPLAEFFTRLADDSVRIDGLAACAGVFATGKPFWELQAAEFTRVIDVNLTGSFLLAKYGGRLMIPQRAGTIVLIGCIRSRIFRPNMADYAASKGAIRALTSAMALDASRYGIRVNSIAPGFTRTGMTEKAFSDPEISRRSETLIPAGRIASPDDIATVVLFLLSDLSTYVNGETITADGGFSLEK
ncbi:MAG TPA: SDR family oxidoreductase [Spirochaetia bacterium]|nr:SDR family oxidoreductase [Spirochaetia bacterium]